MYILKIELSMFCLLYLDIASQIQLSGNLKFCFVNMLTNEMFKSFLFLGNGFQNDNT